MTDRRSTAARRLDLGLALRDAGEPAAAAEALAAACEADPDYAEAHFARAEALAASGDQAGAADAFRRYLALEPSDRMGATPRLALLDAAPTPTRLPAAYVAALFDEYAPRFDQALQGALAYRAPEHLGAALMRRLDSLPNAGTARGLDLGCGTGLVGRAVRLALGALDGIDLSEEMLKRAAATGLAASLSAYGAQPLGDYAGPNGTTNNELLELLSALYNGEMRPVRRPGDDVDIGHMLPYRRVSFGLDALEQRGSGAPDFSAILGLKDYPEATTPGLLDALLRLPYEMIVSESYAPTERQTARERMDLAIRRLKSADEEAAAERGDMLAARDARAEEIALGGRQVQQAAAAVAEGKGDLRMRHGQALDSVQGMAALGAFRFQEFKPGRSREKEVAHLDGGAGPARRRLRL